MIDKRITILSDGTALGTRVIDSDGKPIEGTITAVEWRIDAVGRIGEARITFAAPLVRLDGEASPDG